MRVALRVAVIAALAGLAWLAWHPGALSTALTVPVLLTESRHPLAPGVQVRVGRVALRDWKVIDFEVDLARAHLRVGTAPGGGKLSELIPEGAVAAINGAFFEKDFSPHGWLIDRGLELHAKAESSPHHLFAIRGTEVFGGRWESLPFEPEFAMQNFPLLVENGAARIKADDADPGFPRTLICDAGHGIVHLLVILPGESTGPTLFETARIAELSDFGCLSAVNLDGGPSSGYWIDPKKNVPSAEPPVRIGHSLAIVPN